MFGLTHTLLLRLRADNTDMIRMASGNIDRISSLPIELVGHILSFMKTKQAVQFCTISERWKDLWTVVPTIDISQEDFECREKFERFVNHALSCRKTSYLHTFSIRCPNQVCGLRFCDRYRKWICSALNLKPRVCIIDLCVSYYDNFAGSAFACESIEDMSIAIYKSTWLKDCLNIVPNTVNLPRIRGLRLTRTCLNEEIAVKLLTGCPVLEDLTLKNCCGVFSSIFLSDKLKSLSLVDCHKVYCTRMVLSETLPKIVDLSCIRRFHITKAYIGEEGIARLLIGSPLLEHLSFEECVGEFSILFRQKLKYLSIRDCTMNAGCKEEIWWEINSVIVKFHPSEGTVKSKGHIVCTLYPSTFIMKSNRNTPISSSWCFQNNFDPSIIFSGAESLELYFKNSKIDLTTKELGKMDTNRLKNLSIELAKWFRYEIDLIVWFLRNSSDVEEITLYHPMLQPVSTSMNGKAERLIPFPESAYKTNFFVELPVFSSLKSVEIKLFRHMFTYHSFNEPVLGETGESVNIKIVLSDMAGGQETVMR